VAKAGGARRPLAAALEDIVKSFQHIFREQKLRNRRSFQAARELILETIDQAGVGSCKTFDFGDGKEARALTPSDVQNLRQKGAGRRRDLRPPGACKPAVDGSPSPTAPVRDGMGPRLLSSTRNSVRSSKA
jgi:hypothetical protein